MTDDGGCNNPTPAEREAKLRAQLHAAEAERQRCADGWDKAGLWAKELEAERDRLKETVGQLQHERLTEYVPSQGERGEVEPDYDSIRAALVASQERLRLDRSNASLQEFLDATQRAIEALPSVDAHRALAAKLRAVEAERDRLKSELDIANFEWDERDSELVEQIRAIELWCGNNLDHDTSGRFRAMLEMLRIKQERDRQPSPSGQGEKDSRDRAQVAEDQTALPVGSVATDPARASAGPDSKGSAGSGGEVETTEGTCFAQWLKTCREQCESAERAAGEPHKSHFTILAIENLARAVEDLERRK